MREILFRGYSEDYKKWCYGFLKGGWDEQWYIEFYINRSLQKYRVDVNSIGQYTGFKDKNGKKIFEGDVLHWNIDYYGYAEMINGRWMILPEVISSEEYYIDELANIVEIIGNVYEEQLKEK